MAVEHRFVETNGIRLHCAVDGEGPLVVFLHGFPESSWSWRHQMAALAPRFRVVAPDMRGYGDSDKPDGVKAYDLKELVADVEGLIRAFDEKWAVVVGHDWGGGIAWQFAVDRPQMTRRLVVMNCPHPAIFQEHLRTNPKQLAKSWYMFFFQIPWLPETLLGLNGAWPVANAIRSSAIRKDAITDEDLARVREAASRPGALHAAINYYRAVFRSDEAQAGLPPWLRRFIHGDAAPVATRPRPEDWPKVTSPTLLIWGEQDVALRKELTLGLERVVSAPFEVKYIPDSGHWVQQEAADEVNRLLLAFLDDLAPSPSALPSAPAS